MDRTEKKRLREHVGEYLDVSHARLTDDEAVKLAQFVDEYDENYKGHSSSRTRSRDGWSSDGKYTREESFTETFTDDVCIRFDYEYRDDDGQTGSSTSVVKDARGILNWLRRN